MSSVKTKSETGNGHTVVTTATSNNATAGTPTIMSGLPANVGGPTYTDSPKGAGKKKNTEPPKTTIRRRLSVVGGATMDGIGEVMASVSLAGAPSGTSPYISAFESRKGYAPHGGKKVNQDTPVNFSATSPIGDVYSFYGALDGHGEFGHLVSQQLVQKFQAGMTKLIEEGKFPGTKEGVAEVMSSRLLDDEKVMNSRACQINTEFSGTTMTIGCVYGIDGKQHLTSINAGDSRLIFGLKNASGGCDTLEVTEDHKPDLPVEMARIQKAGGRVFALSYPGVDPATIPARVWLGNQDIPGLAMSRSLGDMCAHRAGVISTPEVFQTPVPSNAIYLCVASDGLWEFMSNEEVLEIIHRNVQRAGEEMLSGLQAANEELCEKSRALWLSEEQVVDDTTMVCVSMVAAA